MGFSLSLHPFFDLLLGEDVSIAEGYFGEVDSLGQCIGSVMAYA
ncbi:hypothetical protein DSBG_2093 [Desulfosporosinus sp. BG]|nr:hypothetical protein DSBG_2093 [Desulfosporosinus sp. BG]